jgi:putative tryptophan/tyrosine transport system substrate-binding protein
VAGSRESRPAESRGGLDLIRRPPHHPGMDRRRFLLTSLAGALAAPLAAEAQQRKRSHRVGFLARGDDVSARPVVNAFRDELRTLGYTEGENLIIEWRWAGEHHERLLEMPIGLVRAGMDVIVSVGTVETRAAQQATSTVPLVMVHVADPVGAGFASSVARPGGNITGLAILFPEVSVKQLEFFRELVVGAKVVAVLWNPSNPSHPPALRALEQAAPKLGAKLQPVSRQETGGLEQAVTRVGKDKIGALLVLGEPAVFAERQRLAELTLKHHIATMFLLKEHVEVGGLVAYGPSFPDLFRRAAHYVDKILRGAKAADLPIEQPTKFELVINLKTAKALGLPIPPSLLARADQVIE